MRATRRCRHRSRVATYTWITIYITGWSNYNLCFITKLNVRLEKPNMREVGPLQMEKNMLAFWWRRAQKTEKKK